MEKFKVAIVAFAASAAILVPAGSVGAATQRASDPTTAAAACILLCFDLYEDRFRVGQDVDAMTALKFCYGTLPPPVPISALQIGQKLACYPYEGHQRWIVRTR